VGHGKVLLPWGATEKVSRQIDATSPEDLTYAELACRKQVMAEFDRLRAKLDREGPDGLTPKEQHFLLGLRRRALGDRGEPS